MSRMLALAAAVLLLQAPAQTSAPGKLRWVPNPTRTTKGWVSDPARHLQPATVAAIDSVVFALERETTAEIAVVVIDSLDGLEPADAALLLHRRWGVGKRDRNNGLVFLWSPALRKLHVSVGYRLEGVLPDARVGRILDEVVLPRFRRDSFDVGVLNGVKALAAATREEVAWNASTGVPAYHPELAPEVAEAPAVQPLQGAPSGTSSRDGTNVLGSLLGIGAALLAVVYWIFRRRYRPPRCPQGHGPMTRLDEQRDDAHLAGEERIEEQVGSIDYDVWACGQCGAVTVKPWTRWFSGYEQCSRCRRRTLKTTHRTLRSATESSYGLEEVTTRCANCGRYDVRRVETPKISSSSGSSSFGGGGGGGGGFGGGGGGSSFGGGSAGGGGAGRSY